MSEREILLEMRIDELNEQLAERDSALDIAAMELVKVSGLFTKEVTISTKLKAVLESALVYVELYYNISGIDGNKVASVIRQCRDLDNI